MPGSMRMVKPMVRNAEGKGCASYGGVTNAIDCYWNGLASVFLLVFMRNPFAVFGAIWTVIVDALNRHAIGFFSHIFEKIREFVPSVANKYSASAVSLKVFSTTPVASPHHVVPAGKGGALFVAYSMPVNGRPWLSFHGPHYSWFLN